MSNLTNITLVNGNPQGGNGVVSTIDALLAQQTITWTQTTVAVPNTASVTLIAANPVRKALRWQNTGQFDATVSTVNPAIFANGMIYPGTNSPFMAGSSELFYWGISNQAFYAIGGPSGNTTLIIWEGT